MHSRVIAVLLLLVSIVVLVLASCGRMSLINPGDGRNAAGFAITAYPDAAVFPAAAGRLALELVPAGNDNRVLTLQVKVAAARNLKAAYFQVAYDPARFTPLSADAGPALRGLAAGQPLLELNVLNRPGHVYCGQCLARWQERDGFSGSGRLATLRFMRRPYAAIRQVSTPPSSDLSRTTLSYDVGLNVLAWRFYNQGDYDQNGEVNISDLTPLGGHFGDTVTYPGDENTAAAVADGDHNGELNIADLTPIGSNYGRNLSGGWRVYISNDVAQYPAAWDDDDGTATLLGTVACGDYDPATLPGIERVLYHYAPAAVPTVDQLFWVRPVDSDGAEGIASNYAAVGSSNVPPTAVLISNPGLGTAPLLVNFDATGSSDTDGLIVSYDWDWDGDGTYELVGGGSTETHTYDTPGSYMATVRVQDDDGGVGTDQDVIQVDAAASWHLQAIDTANDDGKWSSLAEIGGRPAISFWDQTALNLMYVRALDAQGDSWGTPLAADNSGQVGDSGREGNTTSMKELAGAPGIAYYRDHKLYFVRASDSDGTLWGTPVPTALDGDALTDVGQHASLTLVNGQPAISYFDATNWDLKYIQSDSGDGTSWLNPPIVVDGAGVMVGRNTSLAVIGGLPCISYLDSTANLLAFAFSSDANGAAGSWTTSYPSTVPLSGYQGTSLCEVDGLPAISFQTVTTSRLHYARAADSSYFVWNEQEVTPTDVATHGVYPSLLVYNGAPAISYAREGASMLCFVTAADAAGVGWNERQDVDTAAAGLLFTSLALIGGQPAISYYDEATHNLKYAIYY